MDLMSKAAMIQGSREFVRQEILAWLLEESNPSVRYLTLINLLGRKEDEPQVRQARSAIMRTGVVPEILARQTEMARRHCGGGYFNSAGYFLITGYLRV